MRFHVMTLFPEMFDVMHTSVIGRAMERGLIALRTYQIRDFSDDAKHHKVDDYTYGGGAGMLMRAQPVYDCYRYVLGVVGCVPPASADDDSSSLYCAGHSAEPVVSAPWHTSRSEENMRPPGTAGGRSANDLSAKLRTVYLTPQGIPFTQEMARGLARAEDVVLLCGHYEGVDERVLEEIEAERISIGDYVLSGGELPAMVLIDAVARLVPGVLSNEESAQTESFDDGLLEYPQYTRPEVWRDRCVPEILLSGDHAKVDAWRKEQAVARTREMRPDLLADGGVG